jgi:hypothetical protein
MVIDLKTRLGRYVETSAGGERVRAYVPLYFRQNRRFRLKASLID